MDGIGISIFKVAKERNKEKNEEKNQILYISHPTNLNIKNI